ncbi:hypothetical protein [Salipiger sp.]|uniref:hypothetical protein n=1 Tax=Salipiger sp. TaxID=2078585 RepID=UPI003A96F8D7
MTSTPTQLGEVTYNAAEQRFEALVTFHTDRGRVRVASFFDAPMSTGYDSAARGLKTQAMRMLDKPDALQSRLRTNSVGPDRERPRSGFLGWLTARRQRAEQRAA